MLLLFCAGLLDKEPPTATNRQLTSGLEDLEHAGSARTVHCRSEPCYVGGQIAADPGNLIDCSLVSVGLALSLCCDHLHSYHCTLALNQKVFQT